MPEVVVLNYKDPRVQLSDFRSQIDAIFFDSSTKKEFKSLQDKTEFNWKYLGFYLSHYPEYSWLAVQGQTVLGYLCAMPFSQDPSLYQIQSHMRAFENEFNAYPAHLHINCHANSRGQGVGLRLVQRCLEQMKGERLPGLHIMTGPDASNRAFYQKLGFRYEVTLNSILFMGIDLK